MKSTVLEENLDDNYEPTASEIVEYAKFLGMDPDEDKDLLWIAKESLKAPLPENWKPCQTEEGDIYYFNFKSGESLWDHPCDNHYRELFKKEKSKKSRNEATIASVNLKEMIPVTKTPNSMLAPIISNRNLAKPLESLPAITSLHHDLKDLNPEERKLAGLLKLKSYTSISALSPIKVTDVLGHEKKQEILEKDLEEIKLENSLEIQKIKDQHFEAKRELELLQEKELKSLQHDLEMRKLEFKERVEKENLNFDLEKEKNKLSSSLERELEEFERKLKENLESEKKKLILEHDRELKESLESEKRAFERELKEKLESQKTIYERESLKTLELEKKTLILEYQRELKESLELEKKAFERELKENLESEKKKLLVNYEKTLQKESEQLKETEINVRNTINESVKTKITENFESKAVQNNTFGNFGFLMLLDQLVQNCHQILDNQNIYSTDLTELSQKKSDDDDFIAQLKMKLSNYTSYASKSMENNRSKSPVNFETGSIVENKNHATKISLIESNDSAILEYLKKVKERNFLDASTLSRYAVLINFRHVLPDQIRKKTAYISSRSKWMAEIRHQEEYLRKF